MGYGGEEEERLGWSVWHINHSYLKAVFGTLNRFFGSDLLISFV